MKSINVLFDLINLTLKIIHLNWPITCCNFCFYTINV